MKKNIYAIVAIITATAIGSVFNFAHKGDNSSGITIFIDYQGMKSKSIMAHFKTMSNEEAARYYASNYRNEPLVNDIYIDSIMPKCQEESLKDMKAIHRYIDGTPADSRFRSIYEDKRNGYINDLSEELASLSKSQYAIFENSTLRFLEAGIDSMLKEDIKTSVDHAVGGFGGYKVLLPFHKKRLEEKWNEVMDEKKYTLYTGRMIGTYISELSSFQEKYFSAATDSVFEASNSQTDVSVKIQLSDSVVNKVDDYSDEQLKDLGLSIGRDTAVSTGIKLALKGYATVPMLVYDLGTFAWGIAKPIIDARAGKPTKEELLIEDCLKSSKAQLQTGAIKRIKDDMKKLITDSNNRLLEEIDKSYEI